MEKYITPVSPELAKLELRLDPDFSSQILDSGLGVPRGIHGLEDDHREDEVSGTSLCDLEPRIA